MSTPVANSDGGLNRSTQHAALQIAELVELEQRMMTGAGEVVVVGVAFDRPGRFLRAADALHRADGVRRHSFF